VGDVSVTDGTWNRKGMFSFPENVRDLIDLFLDPVVRRARHRMNQRIERQVGVSQGIKSVQKAVVGIKALNVQAQRNRAGHGAMNQR